MMPLKKNAFTLIELLIVVAIIAILAAIAIPNLLEAQVRSKVSRVKADQRTYATALESYAVDNNDYPPLIDWNVPSIIVPFEEALIPLSTPVSYLSNALIPEPFNNHKGWLLYRGWNVYDAGGPPPDRATRIPLYLYLPMPNDEIVSGKTTLLIVFLSAYNITLTAEEVQEMLGKHWLVASPGPDTFYRFDQYIAQDPGAAADPIGPVFDQLASLMLPRLNRIYDPTNGTTSPGDIGRSGAGLLIEKK